MPEIVFGSLVSAKMQLLAVLVCIIPVQKKELREGDTKDCKILRKILVKICFSE